VSKVALEKAVECIFQDKGTTDVLKALYRGDEWRGGVITHSFLLTIADYLSDLKEWLDPPFYKRAVHVRFPAHLVSEASAVAEMDRDPAANFAEALPHRCSCGHKGSVPPHSSPVPHWGGFTAKACVPFLSRAACVSDANDALQRMVVQKFLAKDVNGRAGTASCREGSRLAGRKAEFVGLPSRARRALRSHSQRSTNQTHLHADVPEGHGASVPQRVPDADAGEPFGRG
jgi:hypothetical protein